MTETPRRPRARVLRLLLVGLASLLAAGGALAEPAQSSGLPQWLTELMPWFFASVGWVYGVIKDRQARRAAGKNRRREFLKRQLEEFYAPALGKAEEIMAKFEARTACGEAIGEVLEQGAVEDARASFDHFLEYERRQLPEAILPPYREIAELFREKRSLIEPSTMEFQPALVTFLNVWDRHLTTGLNSKVVEVLRREQRPMRPLFEDLARHVDRLRTELQTD